jgi:hypothetical protein
VKIEISGVHVFHRAVESVQLVQTAPGFWCARVRTVSGVDHDTMGPTQEEAEKHVRDIINCIARDCLWTDHSIRNTGAPMQRVEAKLRRDPYHTY